jgi:hypothetical protein
LNVLESIVAARKKGPMTSVSAPKPPENATLSEQVDFVMRHGLDCEVDYTCYRGNNGGSERAVFVLHDGRNVVTLKTPYKGKPARVEVKPYLNEDDFKKALSAAHFSLSRSGYAKSQITTDKGTFTQATTLWASCFLEHYHRDPTGQAQFLRLVGAQDANAFQRVTAKAEKIEDDQRAVEAENRYAGNSRYGMF